MSPRRAATPRPKTISAEGVLGQKGINLIERIVLDMGSQWTPSGPNEVGIDGYIEFFDPSTRKPLGRTVAVQSKVRSAIGGDSSPNFRFQCKRADIEYWRDGNIPVILIVSNPSTNEAYWICVNEYFENWTPDSPTNVSFNKIAQQFSPTTLKLLLDIAVPRKGLYLAATRKHEHLHSNLLQIKALPQHIFVAQTPCKSATDVWSLLQEYDNADGAWVIHKHSLTSFEDLANAPWTSVSEQGTVEKFSTTEWSDSNEPERQRLFVQLLNRTLREQLNPRVRYWPAEECFAIATTRSPRPRTVHGEYRALKRKSKIAVISYFSKTSDDGRVYSSFRHMAFHGQFRRIEDEWFLEITPTYRFTKDGFELERFHSEKLKGIKKIEGNRSVLSNVMFWADYLYRTDLLFEATRQRIRFGELLTFEAEIGINDAHWGDNDGAEETDFQRHDDLLLLANV